MARKLARARPRLPRYAVAWFPDFAGVERIEAFRARHDPVAGLIPAHLSFVFPFPASHTRLQVRTHLARRISPWPVIPASFRAVRLHANEFVFLMASRGRESIAALHDRLYTGLLAPHLRRDLPYEPHITLARHADPEAAEAALEEAREAFGDEMRGVIRALHLLEVHPGGRIAPLETIPLQSA